MGVDDSTNASSGTINKMNTNEAVASPCWARGKKMFLQALLDSKRPPSKIEIEEFMKDNAHLDNTVEDCKKLQNSADAAYSGGRAGKFIGKLLDTLLIVKEVADPFLEFAPESISLAWFAISSMIEIGAADRENCEIIFGACNNITAILLTCRLYENRYHGKQAGSIESREIGSAEVEAKIMGSIPDIIATILDFSWHVRISFKKNRFVRALRDAFSPKLQEKITAIEAGYANLRTIANDAFQERIMDMVDDLRQSLKQDKAELQAIFFPALDDIRSKLEDISAIKASMDMSKLRERFQIQRASLRPSNVHLQMFQSTFDPVSRFEDHICQWIFADSVYRRWETKNGSLQDKPSCRQTDTDKQLNGEDTSQDELPNIFYIQARPGFGKSVALASVVRRISKNCPNSILCYFFFKQGDDATQSTLSALTSLAAQLFDDRNLETEEEINSLMTALEQASGESMGTTDDILSCAILKDAIRSFSKVIKKQIYLVIDALDECVDYESEELVSFLSSVSSDGCLKVVLSSRENEDLEKYFHKDPTSDEQGQLKSHEKLEETGSFCILSKKAIILNITEECNSSDMEIFLNSSLERIMSHRSAGGSFASPKYQAIQKKETIRIAKSIKEKSNGMFTYAAMVAANLEQPSKFTLAQKLKNLPDGMNDLYRQRLESLSLAEKKLVAEALRYTVWGFNKFTTIEIAEHYKKIYDVSTEELEVETTSEGPESPDAQNTETYDAMTDPEIIETIYHLTRCGRDFFKFTNNQKDIDVVHKTVRDWVIAEAEKQARRKDANTTAAPDFQLDENGGLRMMVSIPSTTHFVDAGGIDSVELQAQRDAHLDIMTSLLTSLTSPKFARRYFQDTEGAATRVANENGSIETAEALDKSPLTTHHSFPVGAASRKNRSFRYEVTHLTHHLDRIETLWPKEERRGARWTQFWTKLGEFVSLDKPYFRAWATQWGQYSSDNPAEQERCTSSSWKPVHLAAEAGSLILMEFLVTKQGAEVNEPDKYGGIPLVLGIDNHEVTEFLLRNGADSNYIYEGEQAFNRYLEACLTSYINQGEADVSKEVCQLFIAGGADINARSAEGGRSPLDLAVTLGLLEIVEMLMEQPGIDIKATDNADRTALHWALIPHGRDRGIPDGYRKKIVERLLEAGCDPNHQDHLSTGPLQYAVRSHDRACVELLLQNGADPNDDDTNGNTALISSVFGKDIPMKLLHEAPESITRLLLMYDADLERENKMGLSALFCSAEQGFESVFSLLIREYQKRYGSQDLSYALKAYATGKRTLLHAAASNAMDSLAIIKQMCRLWTSEQLQDMIHQPCGNGAKVAYYAAGSGNLDTLKYLVELGAELSTQTDVTNIFELTIENWTRATRRMKSCSKEHTQRQKDLEDICLFLLETSPELLKTDRQSDFLAAAILRDSDRLLSKFKDCGIDIEAIDEHGWSAFEHAYSSRSLDKARKLPIFSEWQNCPNQKPRETNVPSKLELSDIPCLFILSDDGLTLETVTAEEIPQVLEIQVASNCPVAAHKPVFYWEITLLESFPEHFYIGYNGDTAITCSPPGLMALAETYGLCGTGLAHSNIYANSEHDQAATPKIFAPSGTSKFANGDTIGSGYSLETGVIFYTINGRYLGAVFEDVRGRLWPAIGSYSPCKGTVNFGAEPFMFEEMNS
ncbi:hypothetical protein TWF694_005091 [Orbilia ellipsospora]|uniref:B30.2/SPRY domain-containing protein n=1 Tax=Orbilia ellipsospora TaxID=2528407 RepID=A0AAV9WVK5_9PEZI